MTNELVFTVGSRGATPVSRISLAEAGFKERADLQEWVINHPRILGEGIRIITLEFDQWESIEGKQRDRLDVLGLDVDGRPVVAELKRGNAPTTTELQAIKYAAMASRATPDDLAAWHAKFLNHRSADTDAAFVSNEEAADLLELHTQAPLSPETLGQPRIVLVASDYPKDLTSSVVWLSEMGLDITLIQYQAYRSGTETLLTVSQLYPIADVAEFVVKPARTARNVAAAMDEVDWSEADLLRMAAENPNPTVLAMMDLTAKSPGEWVTFKDVLVAAGRSQREGMGDADGCTMFIKKRFKRPNWPVDRSYTEQGEALYRMDSDSAEIRRATRDDQIKEADSEF